jgi:hypothetical protein
MVVGGQGAGHEPEAGRVQERRFRIRPEYARLPTMSQGPPTSGGAQSPQPEQPAQPAVPAGWYPHPTAPGWEAYWDGAAWGAETRPAQEPVAQEPVAQEPVAQEPQATVPAAQPHETGVGTPAQAAAVPVATAGAPAAAKEGSDSSMSLVLCMLGAVVAIVGSFLPAATSDVFTDIADNTMVAAGYGIAVIVAAALAAAIAAYCYVKATRTWLPILLGVVVVAIAVYAGTAGLDITPEGLPTGTPTGTDPNGPGADLLAAVDDDGSPSTGIFTVGIGGLLIVLGGIGIARQPK